MAEEKKFPIPVAGVFIFNEKGEILLLKLRQWHNKYSCPAGKVEIGESLEQAAIREVKEETNLELKDIKFLAVEDGLNIRERNIRNYEHLVNIAFVARLAGQEKLKIEEKEIISYRWLSPAEWLRRDINDFTHISVYRFLERLKHGYPEDYEHKYKRALADYQNLVKQTFKEKEEFAKYANEMLLHELIPVYDNLKLSLKHIDETADKNGWAEGIRHIVKQFSDALNNLGVVEIKTIGEKFDHYTMEAVENEITGDGQKEDTVAKELKSGYKLNGKVIIPARVAVYRLAKE
ncbi:MAG: nucleotide exchange factor GrpE [Planctomycetes bacterium]|jgi:molecular chaperone GrpE (heat shock protein)|nr:nucleotide exchange factor GrpE [Planctomycetota bacterium]